MLDKNDRFDIQMFWVYRLLLGRGDVAIDVGANQGAHTAVMAEAVGSTGAIFAFEPIPMLFHGLRARFKDQPFIRILPLAISDTDATAKFFVNTTNVSFCSGFEIGCVQPRHFVEYGNRDASNRFARISEYTLNTARKV